MAFEDDKNSRCSMDDIDHMPEVATQIRIKVLQEVVSSMMPACTHRIQMPII
jgi:hypothetical protein